jgi:hypothetical protein
MITETRWDDPIFTLSDVVDFTGIDARRILIWIQRGIIETRHKPKGKGDVRRYTLGELMWVKILSELADTHRLEPKAYGELARSMAELVCYSADETIIHTRFGWAVVLASEPGSVSVFNEGTTLDFVGKTLKADSFCAVKFGPHYESLRAAKRLGEVILSRKQFRKGAIEK